MSWIDILKSNQITVGSTTLDTRALPEEEEDNECWKKLMQMKALLKAMRKKLNE